MASKSKAKLTETCAPSLAPALSPRSARVASRERARSCRRWPETWRSFPRSPRRSTSTRRSGSSTHTGMRTRSRSRRSPTSASVSGYVCARSERRQPPNRRWKLTKPSSFARACLLLCSPLLSSSLLFSPCVVAALLLPHARGIDLHPQHVQARQEARRGGLRARRV